MLREDVRVTAADLLEAPSGARTEAGLRHNVRVGVQYVEAWLRGQGCVPLYDLMEDAATAEISRTQVWQWLKHRADVDGATLTTPRFRAVLTDELSRLSAELGDVGMRQGRFDEYPFRFMDYKSRFNREGRSLISPSTCSICSLLTGWF